jgi:hypothetical protein
MDCTAVAIQLGLEVQAAATATAVAVDFGWVENSASVWLSLLL